MTVLTLQEVKDHLNVTSAGNDTELMSFVARTEAALTSRCGPLAPVSVTARVRGWGYMLSPKTTPILSLTSVTPVGGSALTLSTMVTPDNGLRGPSCIEYLDGTPFTDRWYDVVYQAGRNPLPDDLKMAALEIVRYFWQTQLGNAPSALPATGDIDAQPIMRGESFPWLRVQHLVEPYEQVWI